MYRFISSLSQYFVIVKTQPVASVNNFIVADIMLDDNADYRCKDSRRLKCTNIEAQMDLLQSMMDKISNMTCEVMLPPMARI